MGHTASTIATELKRQIIGQLPANPRFGGFHHLEVRASMRCEVSASVRFDALSELMEQLSAEACEWDLEFHGDIADLIVIFTR